jgi:hypothetical protein
MTTKVRLSKREMAVAIAKDVLHRLKLEKLTLKFGNYLLPNGSFPSTGSLQEKIDKAEANCQVCALGGMFLSYVRLHNKVQCENMCIDSPLALIVDKLSKVFTQTEIALIEGVFEGVVFNSYLISSTQNVPLLVSACEKYRRMIIKRAKVGNEYGLMHQYLLTTICRNIIRNKGKFVIPKNCYIGI